MPAGQHSAPMTRIRRGVTSWVKLRLGPASSCAGRDRPSRLLMLRALLRSSKHRRGMRIIGAGRGGEIRTHDLLVPNQALYQAKLRPEDRGLEDGSDPRSSKQLCRHRTDCSRSGPRLMRMRQPRLDLAGALLSCSWIPDSAWLMLPVSLMKSARCCAALPSALLRVPASRKWNTFHVSA